MNAEHALAILRAIKLQTAAIDALVDTLVDRLRPVPDPEPTGPRCPHCGSPKFADLTGMGGKTEYQCTDCGAHYEG